MQVGEPLNGIGEGLLVDLGVLRPDPVANGAIGSPGRVLDDPLVNTTRLDWMTRLVEMSADSGRRFFPARRRATRR
jgi:hypothetical protein